MGLKATAAAAAAKLSDALNKADTDDATAVAADTQRAASDKAVDDAVVELNSAIAAYSKPPTDGSTTLAP